ncbi:MAG TPA: GrpB family protein [Gaiellaceae bacterium]
MEILVVPYDAEWPRRFEAEQAVLEPVLAPWLDGGIHHIGSTAIPGIAAKPLIDMMAGVRDFEEARAAYQPLLALGWEHTPHRPGIAHHFSKPSFGLHLTEPGSDLWRERLAFRDALRADPKLARRYEELKLRLARDHDEARGYTQAKRPFVASVLAESGIVPGRR